MKTKSQYDAIMYAGQLKQLADTVEQQIESIPPYFSPTAPQIRNSCHRLQSILVACLDTEPEQVELNLLGLCQ